MQDEPELKQKVDYWLMLWIKPSAVIEQISSAYTWRTIVLISVMGILAVALMMVTENHRFLSSRYTIENARYMKLIFTGLFVGGFYMLAVLLLSCIRVAFIKFIGFMFGGRGRFTHLFMLQMIMLVPCIEWLLLGSFGNCIRAFSREYLDLAYGTSRTLYYAYQGSAMFICFGINIYIYVLSVIGTTRLQGYQSHWRGFFNLVIADIILILISAVFVLMPLLYLAYGLH